MKSPYSFIQNSNRLIDVFGYWPTFHDSPITRSVHTDDRLEVDLKVWEMTSETDDQGYFILTKRHTVTFLIEGIIEYVNPLSFSTENGLCWHIYNLDELIWLLFLNIFLLKNEVNMY